MKNALSFIGFGLLLLFFYGFSVTSVNTPPGNALLFVDTTNQVYLSPGCLLDKKDLSFLEYRKDGQPKTKENGNITQRELIALMNSGATIGAQTGTTPDNLQTFLPMTYSLMLKLKTTMPKLEPAEDCRNQSGFIQDGRSVSGAIFERLGILSPIPSRWNSDGSWNY